MASMNKEKQVLSPLLKHTMTIPSQLYVHAPGCPAIPKPGSSGGSVGKTKPGAAYQSCTCNLCQVRFRRMLRAYSIKGAIAHSGTFFSFHHPKKTVRQGQELRLPRAGLHVHGRRLSGHLSPHGRSGNVLPRVRRLLNTDPRTYMCNHYVCCVVCAVLCCKFHVR